MKCEHVRELVSDALDGALGAGTADRFHAHLQECPPCRAYHTELKETLLLLEELPVVSVGEEFDRAVWARIREEERSDSFVDLVRERWEMFRLRFSFGTGTWRWAPAGVGALVLGAVVVTSNGWESLQREGAVGREEVANAGRQAAGESSGLDLVAMEPIADTDFGEEEVTADMPDVVETFLESSSMELRLTPDRVYRDAVYSYPIRRVRDQVFESDRHGFVGSPVSAGGGLRGGMPVSTTVPVSGSAGAAVIAF